MTTAPAASRLRRFIRSSPGFAARHAHLLAVAGLWVAAAGCDAGNPPAVAASSLEDGCVQLVQAWKGSLASCSSLTFFNPDGNEGMDVAQVLDSALSSGWCPYLSTAFEASQARGSLTIDLAALGGCVDRVRTWSGCEGFAATFSPRVYPMSPVAVCPEAFAGRVGEGGPCVTSTECRSGMYCTDGPSGTCTGTCTKRKAVGAECDSADSCVVGATCRDDGRCEALASAGDPCTTQLCGPGTVCDDFEADEFRWAATCRVLVPTDGPTAPCSITGDDGRYHVCPAGTWCRLPYGEHQGSCIATPGRGAPCIDLVPCAAGLSCVAGVCRDGLPAGTTCDPAGEGTCGYGGYCAATGTGAADEATATYACRQDFTVADDGACSTPRDCASHACVDGTCLTDAAAAVLDPCRMSGL